MMNLSINTIKQLIKYLSGIENLSVGYDSGDDVIHDFQQYFLFRDYRQDELRYTVEEALHDGLNALNKDKLLFKYLNTRIDKGLFLLNEKVNFQKSITILNEILFQDGYIAFESETGSYEIGKIDKNNSKEEYTDALWALADDLRHRREQGEFLTYEEAYIFGSKHYTHNGAEIKPLSLRNEWHKASSAGRV